MKLKIFKFIRLVKKLLICFPLFLSMIKSSIYTTTSPSFKRVTSTKSNEFGSSSWLLHVFHVIILWNPRVLVYYLNFPHSGIYLPFRNHRFWPFIIVGTINHCNTNCMRKLHSTTLSFHFSMNRNSRVAK